MDWRTEAAVKRASSFLKWRASPTSKCARETVSKCQLLLTRLSLSPFLSNPRSRTLLLLLLSNKYGSCNSADNTSCHLLLL